MKHNHTTLFLILNAAVVVTGMNLIEYLFFAPYHFSILSKILVPAIVCIGINIMYDVRVLKL